MASQVKMNALATILIVGFLSFHSLVESTHHHGYEKSTLDTRQISLGCDGATFNKTDAFAASVFSVLEELVNVTPTTSYFDYFNRSPYNTSVIFGHASCNSTLTATSCKKCLKIANTTVLGGSCGDVVNSQIVLGHCKIEYQTAKFPEHPIA